MRNGVCVPEDIAEFFDDFVFVGIRDFSLFLAQNLFEFFEHFTTFAAESEDETEQPRACISELVIVGHRGDCFF